MNSSTPRKILLTLGLLVVSNAIFAVTPAEDVEKKCIKPKFRDFAPATQSDVDPGSDISFHVSHNAEASTIRAEAKGQKLAVTVKDRKTFYEVKSQLPKELVNSFARISVQARALEGECIGHDGWLLKIRDQEGKAATSSHTADKVETH